MINEPSARLETNSKDLSNSFLTCREISNPSKYCLTTPNKPGKLFLDGEPLMISLMVNSSYSSSIGPKDDGDPERGDVVEEELVAGVGEGALEGE